WGGNRNNNNNNNNTTSWAARAAAAAAASSSAGSGTKRATSTTTPTTGGVPNTTTTTTTKQQHLLPQPPTATTSPTQAGSGSTTFNAKEAAEFLNKRYDATNERYAAWAQLPEGRRKQQQFDRQTVHKYVAEKNWANRGGSMMPGKEDFVHQLEQAILMMSSGPGKKPTTTNSSNQAV
ncbi:hypothetical protein FOZ63_017431, partial [Perkinsus olseni]